MKSMPMPIWSSGERMDIIFRLFKKEIFVRIFFENTSRGRDLHIHIDRNQRTVN